MSIFSRNPRKLTSLTC